MAPMTRSGHSFGVDGAPSPSKNGRENGWGFPGSEGKQSTRRKKSADMGGSLMNGHKEDPHGTSSILQGTSEYEEELFPLKATADRVGREVEKFAEQLDKLSSLVHDKPEDKRENVLMLVDEYQDLARDAIDRLRRRHGVKRRAVTNSHWRRRVKSFQSVQLEDANESDESYDDEEEYQDNQGYTDVSDLLYWELEEQTWNLLRKLLEVRYPGETDKNASDNDINRFSSEERIWDHFLGTNSLARERHVVLTWLQETAEQSGEDIDIIAEQLEAGAQGTKGLWAHGWLHTKEAIKAQKRMRSWAQSIDPAAAGIAASLVNADKTEPLVTQLDPDAVTRQDRVVEKQDEYFERATWLTCWEMLRRGGSWAEIRDWCRDRVDGWRAVSMRGNVPAWDMAIDGEPVSSAMTLFRDPSIASREDGHPMSQIAGTRSRSLWRRMCFYLAREGGVDEYERAVYGLLGGDLDSVMDVCTTWDDYLFAHYNALLCTEFDAHMKAQFPTRYPEAALRKLGHFDAVGFHGDPQSTARRIVDNLKKYKQGSDEDWSPMKMIQGVLIADEFPDCLNEQGKSLSKLANLDQRSKIIPPLADSDRNLTNTPIELDDYDALRVLTHMLFVFQDLGVNIGKGSHCVAVENIVVAYIDFLRLAGKLAMIPLYASRLSSDRQILTLARVLLDSSAVSQRKELVKLMKGFNIDVPSVVETQLRFILDEVMVKEARSDTNQLSILTESSTSSATAMKHVRKGFLDGELSLDCDKLVRSFEWYLLVDGFWEQTFAAGALLYRNFFLSGHLLGARELLTRVSSSQISLTKTTSILGGRIDITSPSAGMEDDEDSYFSVARSTRQSRHRDSQPSVKLSSPEDFRAAIEVLQDQARVFMGFEDLIRALVAMDEWTKVADQTVIPSGANAKSWRNQLQHAFQAVMASMQPLLHGWLLDLPNDKHLADVVVIRERYLPELVLAYVSVIQLAGHVLSREILTQNLNLATIIAAEDSDLLPCFQKSGRLPELVTALATTSKAILKAGEEKSMGAAKTGGRMKRGGGETLGIWNIKS
ncbi:MAG: hypothetical protein M4579_006364 [Chaenotheca gracillima]|nr:MAG: hypothetical protein M4579_006364 [Chaenotheca gracillima]